MVEFAEQRKALFILSLGSGVVAVVRGDISPCIDAGRNAECVPETAVFVHRLPAEEVGARTISLRRREYRRPE